MPQLTDLTLSADEAKSQDYCCSPGDEENLPKYPWGTSLYLSDVVLGKMGITELPEVGQSMTLTATVTVTGVSMRQDQKGIDKTLDLQITAMALDGEKEPDGKAAERMFPTMLAS